MSGNFRKSSYGDRGTRREVRNLITKPGVLFVPPFLRKALPGSSRRQVTEIRVVPPIDERGNEMAILNPQADAKMPLRDVLAETFANLEIARQVGGAPGGVCTDMVTSVRDDEVGNRVRGGWTPYYEMSFHLKRKIRQQRERYMIGLPIDIPRTWIDWMTSGKYEFGFLPTANGHAFTDNKGNAHPEQYLIKCVVVTIDGEPQSANGKPYKGPAVFMVPPSAAPSFLAGIVEPTFEDRQLSADNNRFGDFCSLENGRTIEMVRSPDNRYTLRLGNKKLPLTNAEAKKLDIPWSELVHVPSIEESIQNIAKALGDPAAVAFGLRKDPNNANSGTYERYLPNEWLRLAKDIEPELPKDEHQRVMQSEVQRKSSVSAPPPPPASGNPPPTSGNPPPFRAPPGAFRPADKPPAVDASRYDAALNQMRERIGADGDGIVYDTPGEGDIDVENQEGR